MVTITKVATGRGGWPNDGTGGTLDVTGRKLGSYYRAPAAGSSMRMPGLIAAQAVKNNGTCDVNQYAVYMGVRAYQPYFGAVPDGILGPKTEAAIRNYQLANSLFVDGVIGPQTSRALLQPLVGKAAAKVAGAHRSLAMVASGHIGYESLFDPGAVGYSTPDDLGLGQINGPSHPGLTIDDALTPGTAVTWVVGFVNSNIIAMNGNVNDGIAAYNLGIGGARSWIKAGRPPVWSRTYNNVVYTTDVRTYIDRVLAAAA